MDGVKERNRKGAAKERTVQDLIIDVLELAVLVMGIAFAVRLIGAAYRDRQEHALTEKNYGTYMEQSIQQYSALHTSGNSYASMIYSNGYEEYSCIEEAEMFRRKNQNTDYTYDAAVEKPVIRASICTGEQVAGFKNLTTGKFREVALIRGEKDLKNFKDQCGVTEIAKEY